MQTFNEFYELARGRLESNIGRWLSGREQSENPLIRRGTERLYGMNVGGKRLRGALVYIGYGMMRDDLETADALAEAFELFQTAILIHDDIIDHADSRRGMETIHTLYGRELAGGRDAALDTGRAMALCLGDLGLYAAEERLAEAYGGHPILPRLLSLYHKTIMRTIEGELLDVQLSHMERFGQAIADTGVTLEECILDIYHLKTACYTVIGPLCLGLLLGGASEELIAQMRDVADDLGLIFQMQDDVLGVFGEYEKLGKSVGGDVSEYKQTLLYAYMKERGGEPYERLLRYYGRQELTAEELRQVQTILREAGALDYVQARIDALFASARDKLDRIGEVPEERKMLLRGFMDHMRSREA